jgi:phospholipid/cholesterol/gamma-HCH transport system substrate-binding protein
VSVQRIIASVALVAALAVVVGLVMRGPGQGHTYTLRFTHAGLLVPGAQVQIGGQKEGSVTDIGLTGAGEANVKIQLDRGAPVLRVGTTASLEAPSLSGQANRYVAINPGPATAPELSDGASISSESTTSVVEIDELYNLLDKPTRDGLRNIIRGQRDAFLGRTADAERFYETFAPAVQATDRLFRQLDSDGKSLERFVGATSELARTLHASSDDLQGAVQESAGAVKGFADASEPLKRAIAQMPSTFAEGRRAFAAVRESVPTFETLLARARPALRELPPFARALTAALGNKRTLGNLAALLHGPGAQDDLVDIVRGLPLLESRALPSFRSGRAALQDGRPLVDQLRPYMPDMTSMWGNTGRALAPYDANGHYARVLPQFGAFTEVRGGDGTTRMQPVAPSDRILGLTAPMLRRCAGAASQPTSDGSAPAKPDGVDCDPSQVPSGS